MNRQLLGREARRKGIQALGLCFVPLGRAGAMCLLGMILIDAIHGALETRGGLWGWRRIRRWGERGDQRDWGPAFLAFGAALVLLVVQGKGAWAILCQPFLADSAAALTGLAVGGPVLPAARGKTVVGATAFFVIALGFPLALGVPAPVACALAVTGMMVEAWSPRGLDNLLVPLGGLAVWLLF